MDFSQTASSGQHDLRAGVAPAHAPQQPLTLSVLERLNEAIKGADQTSYSLASTRDRIFGAVPELIAGNQTTGDDPSSLEGQINHRLDQLLARMRRIDHLAESLNSRL